jgi:hypothetical protein
VRLLFDISSGLIFRFQLFPCKNCLTRTAPPPSVKRGPPFFFSFYGACGRISKRLRRGVQQAVPGWILWVQRHNLVVSVALNKATPDSGYSYRTHCSRPSLRQSHSVVSSMSSIVRSEESAQAKHK